MTKDSDRGSGRERDDEDPRPVQPVRECVDHRGGESEERGLYRLKGPDRWQEPGGHRLILRRG